jgi:hypothetical protein
MDMETTLHSEMDIAAINRVAADLQSRAASLVEELGQFESHLGKKVSLLKVKDLKRNIQKEDSLIEKILSKPIADQNAMRTVRSPICVFELRN